MDEINTKSCPACGALCAPGALSCSCGHVFGGEQPVAPQVEAPPPANAYPRPIYPPGFASQTSQSPSVAERIIPTKNPKALMAYYSGCFSFTICPAPLLGPLGIILGILGLQECKRNPSLPGKGHAITGIVLGSITTLIMVVVAAIAIWASFNQPRQG